MYTHQPMHPYPQRPRLRWRLQPWQRMLHLLLMALMIGGNLFTLVQPAAARTLAAPTAQITVNGTTCTLANAITAANTDTATGGCPAGSGADTITIVADVTLAAALPTITSNLTIQGDTATRFVSGAQRFRVFFVNANDTVTVTFRNLTIRDGLAKGGAGGDSDKGNLIANGVYDPSRGAGGGGFGAGGGIYIDSGKVRVQSVTFAGNVAMGGAGGRPNIDGGTAKGGSGVVGSRLAGFGDGGKGGTRGLRWVYSQGGTSILLGGNGEGRHDRFAPAGSQGGSALFGGGGGGGSRDGFAGGGGAAAGGGIFIRTGSLELSNTTFTQNQAIGGPSGGGAATAGNADGAAYYVCTWDKASACSARLVLATGVSVSAVAGVTASSAMNFPANRQGGRAPGNNTIAANNSARPGQGFVGSSVRGSVQNVLVIAANNSTRPDQGFAGSQIAPPANRPGSAVSPATSAKAVSNQPTGAGRPVSAGRSGRVLLLAATLANATAQTDLTPGLTNVVAVAGGDEHGLALKNDGNLVAWGDNHFGQGTVPAGVSSVAAIAAGAYHNLALKSDGSLAAWGDNRLGQSTLPAGLSGVVAIAAGGYHNLALKSDGTVVAWGSNEQGQSSVPTGLSGVVAIAAGAAHSIALRGDGTLVAWGNNSYEQLNIPAGLNDVIDIVAGQYHNVALRLGGSVVAWGRNDIGQSAVPTDLADVVMVAANYYHSLALRMDGTVVTWGGNNDGQRDLPTTVRGVAAIAAGGQHTLLIETIDTTPPTVELINSAGYSNTTSAEFWFMGADDLSDADSLTFQCSLDGAAFTACSNPQAYSALAAGNHTFAVKAVDATGNVTLTPATYTWTINSPAPVLVVDELAPLDSSGQQLILAAQATTTALDFGTATFNRATTVRWITLANNGNANLTITGVTIGGAQAGDFTITTPPPTTLAPNQVANLAVTFAPTAAGLRTATLTITSNAAPYTRDLQGTGTAAPYPTLTVPDTAIKVTNGRFSVPVQLATNGAGLAAVGFVLNYDATCLTFDANDGNGDGIPDGITGLPTGFAPSISHRSTETGGALEIALLDDTQPIATLSDGALVTLAFTVKTDCVTTDGSISLGEVGFAATPAVSFGDANAVDVVGAAIGAAIPLRFNAAPTALALSNHELSENTPAGATIGTISVSDLDSEDTHSYSLVAGEGATDNAAFTLQGTTLKTAIALNYEPKPEYRVRVRVTDNGGLTYEQAFVIKTIDLSEAPTGIATTDGPTSDGNPATLDIKENQPTDTLVAKLDPSNPDTNNSYTYALVTGAGDTDNASFTIVGNQLRSAASFDYESKASYTIRLQITDKLARSVQQPFTVLIGNVDEAVSAVDDTIDPRARIFLGGESSLIDVLANDVTGSGTLSIASVTQPANGGGSVTNNTANVSYTAPQANGSTSFTYQATNGTTTSNNATVSLSYVANQTRGDCNSNGNVAAADFIAIVLEIFDANDTPYNGGPAWWLTHTGDYPGSPLGCDANNSRNGANNSSDSITAADITCSVLIFFGHACGTGLQAASADQAADLSVAAVANGGQTTIPVTLKSGAHAVAAAAFALNLGDSAFAATDADGDGLPDAVTLNVPAGVTKSVVWNAAAKRLEVALYGVNLPLPTLADGVLATVTVDGVATPTLSQVSLSDANGNDLLAPRMNAFLPLVTR